MKRINIGSSFEQKEIVFDDSVTVREAFASAGINLNNSMTVLVNAKRIPSCDYDRSLAALNIKDSDLVTTSQN